MVLKIGLNIEIQNGSARKVYLKLQFENASKHFQITNPKYYLEEIKTSEII